MAVAAPAPDSLEAKLRSARRLAPTNLAAYAWAHHRDDQERRISFAAHHQIMGAVLQNQRDFPYVVFVTAPGYAKSTIGSIVYPAWKIGARKGRIRLGLISNTATQAEGFAGAVRTKIEEEDYQQTFPDVMRDVRRRWTNREMFFSNTPEGANPGLMAMGLDGPILGKRFDEILLDDPSTWADVRSEKTMEDQRNKILNTIIQRFPASSRPPHGDRQTRMAVMMTRFGVRDLLPLFRDDLGFRVIHMPALGYWDRIERCTACGQSAQGSAPPCGHDWREREVEWGEAALWPAVQDREQLLALRESDELIFELVYQGNPEVLAGDTFSDDWFQRAPLPGSFDRVLMGVDTAGGKDRKRGDYMAIVTLGLRGNEVWIIEAWRGRVPAPEQEQMIVTKWETWRDIGWLPEEIVIEDANEGSAVFQHLNVSHRLPLRLVTPEGDKDFRAIALSNRYRAHQIYHPEGESWVRAYEAELLAFPEGAHDDMLDAAVYAYNETRDDSGPRFRVLG